MFHVLLAKIRNRCVALHSTFRDVCTWYSPTLKIKLNVSFRSELCFISQIYSSSQF